MRTGHLDFEFESRADSLEHMRVGIVSDIHCNAAGLELALKRMGTVDELLCAGDAIFEYRFGNEVLEILQDHKAHYVLGNHEHVMLDHRGVRAREAPPVKPENLAYVASRPNTIEMNLDGKHLLMTHASPVAPFTQYVYPGHADLKKFATIEADYIVIGHTHMQMAQRVGRALVVNPGSAGDGRDHRNGRKLSYAVLDTATDQVLIDNFEVGDSEIPEFVEALGRTMIPPRERQTTAARAGWIETVVTDQLRPLNVKRSDRGTSEFAEALREQ